MGSSAMQILGCTPGCLGTWVSRLTIRYGEIGGGGGGCDGDNPVHALFLQSKAGSATDVKIVVNVDMDFEN